MLNSSWKICEDCLTKVELCHDFYLNVLRVNTVVFEASSLEDNNYFSANESIPNVVSIKGENSNDDYRRENKTEKIKSSTAVFPCSKCNRKFSDEKRLEFHLTFHEPINAKARYCSVCQKTTTSESALYQHVKYVHQQCREFCCDVCGKQYR